MSGDQVEVTEGLGRRRGNCRRGAPYLAEGMKVSRMALTGQAVPRADDPL
ncbi:MAG: hypothetical protein IPG64_11610 [Haliea sp.]|nr:hypothetical protein [Haliea sp.]